MATKQYYELALVHNVTMTVRGSNEYAITKRLARCINTDDSVSFEKNLAITVRPLEIHEETKGSLSFKICMNHANSEIGKRSLNKVIPSLAYVERHRLNPMYGISVIFENLDNLEMAKELMRERLKYVENRRDVNSLVNRHILKDAKVGLELLDKLEIK